MEKNWQPLYLETVVEARMKFIKKPMRQMQEIDIIPGTAKANFFSVTYARQIAMLKKAVWAYFLLLIFEGALRKWFLPGFAAPLLIVRDPIALFLIFGAARQGLFNFNIYAYGMMLIGFVGIFTALFLGHGSLSVALFGARILLLQFPLIFVIGAVLEREDIVAIGKVILWIAPFMALLIALQFYSPQSAWVNRGVGGNTEGAGFSGALGYFRPPGTFSFTNGTTLFFGLLAPFVFYFWFNLKNIPKIILIASTAALLLSIPLSISRGLFFSVIVTTIFLLIAVIKQPRYIRAVLGIGIITFLLLLILSNTAFFQTATEAFTSRFDSANKVEGGVKGVIADRYLGGMINALTSNSSNLPFFGYGLGMGTNVGSILLTGSAVFLISEGEWGRTIGEMGILLGLLIIIIRVAVSIKMFYYGYKKLLQKDLLPWLLLSFTLLQIPQGQWAQPTSLGFAVLAGGLTLAALRTDPVE